MTENMKIASPQRVQILRDLANKAVQDCQRAVDTTLDLAIETAGSEMGMFLVALRVSSCFMTGSALAIEEASKANKSLISEEDARILVCCLLLSHQEENPHRDMRDLFFKITGRKAPKLPYILDPTDEERYVNEPV